MHDLRLPNIDFEVNSKRVVDYFNRSNENINEFGVIMANNIHYYSLYLTNSHDEFARRQSNEIIHNLAKTTTYLPNFHIFDDVLTCISDLIANEML